MRSEVPTAAPAAPAAPAAFQSRRDRRVCSLLQRDAFGAAPKASRAKLCTRAAKKGNKIPKRVGIRACPSLSNLVRACPSLISSVLSLPHSCSHPAVSCCPVCRFLRLFVLLWYQYQSTDAPRCVSVVMSGAPGCVWLCSAERTWSLTDQVVALPVCGYPPFCVALPFFFRFHLQIHPL